MSRYTNKTSVESQLYDLLCFGHSHTPTLKKEGKTVVINPGSLVGFMAEKGEVPITYGMYDTISNSAEIWDLEKRERVMVI
jgi:predicted phosphodiesterase